MDRHSPTPWRIENNGFIADANGRYIDWDCCRLTNVKFIVEAVNNYEGLIQERRRLIGELDAAKAHADSEERWANEYFEAKAAAEAECKRLRDLVRRLADIVRHDCDARAMSLTREAYAALGEEVPE